MIRVGQFINNKVIHDKNLKCDAIYNPATGIETKKVERANSTLVDSAIDAAKKAFYSWSNTTPLHRARILFKYKTLIEKHLDEFVQLLIEEHGKTADDAKGEVIRGLEIVEFACGAPHLLKGYFSDSVGRGIDSYTIRQPLGVCVGITPFNFPAMVPLWMFPMALIAGNTFVLKPSGTNPSSSILLGKLLAEAGVPEGVFNVVIGGRDTITQLISHPDVAAVSFVGSTPVARTIYETSAKYGKRCQALGGAKNHGVIMPDADLDLAVNSVIGGAFGSAGERCMALPIVVVVGKKTADDFLSLIKERAGNIVVGPGHQPDAQMGPLVTKEHLAKVLNYVEIGIKEGAKLVVDGREFKPKGYEKGNFMGPCVFDHVTPDMRIYKEEIFGPVLGIVRVPDFKTALQLTNSHEYGNGTAIFTKDGLTAREFARQVAAGMVGINVPVPVPMSFHSFGGFKNSLFGDLHAYGPESIIFYTKQKNVVVTWPSVPKGPEFVFPTMD